MGETRGVGRAGRWFGQRSSATPMQAPRAARLDGLLDREPRELVPEGRPHRRRCRPGCPTSGNRPARRVAPPPAPRAARARREAARSPPRRAAALRRRSEYGGPSEHGVADGGGDRAVVRGEHLGDEERVAVRSGGAARSASISRLGGELGDRRPRTGRRPILARRSAGSRARRARPGAASSAPRRRGSSPRRAPARARPCAPAAAARRGVASSAQWRSSSTTIVGRAAVGREQRRDDLVRAPGADRGIRARRPRLRRGRGRGRAGAA